MGKFDLAKVRAALGSALVAGLFFAGVSPAAGAKID